MDIKQLLDMAVKRHASDLHILPGKPPLLRIHGELIPIENFPTLTAEETEKLIFSTISEEQCQRFERDCVLDLAVSFSDLGHFRVSLLHQVHGISGVFRVVPITVPSFDELNLPQVIKRLLSLTQGMIIVAGATGSGKSTTLAAMVDYINVTNNSHIITLEEPIEYIHKVKKSAINQIQIGRDTPDIATALRASLRQDPDVIMLGEMRDLETIRLALTAAETGHLVLATLHSSSAPMSISRMIDMFPATEKPRVRMLLAETLQAVLCQTLVKRKLNGRIAAFEVMLANPAIRHLIREDMISHMESTIQTSGDIGMCTMNQYLRELVNKQEITVAAARAASYNRELF
ncbi:MAG TPA: PilT/PilU family type 4a pilus ATPase [Gammaproteobacteria bacterium]|jgi:twitching motility protein PilT|nr:PilT/PilU family type 4a pilus ATPase [Gammaproteobacteria bacterium]